MFKLGKTPARRDAVKLKFGSYFDKTKLPTPPKVFGHLSVGQPWQMLGNDNFSDCVWAGAAHETMIWTREGSGSVVKFTDTAVLSDYSAATGFDPNDPDTDQGTDMQEAASYRRKTGIVDAAGARHKIDAYVALRPGNVDDLMTATYLFGAAGVGLEFPDSAMDQFDRHQPWTVVNGAKAAGGHYVPCVGRNSRGDILVVTWGRIQAMTMEFYAKYCDEAVAYISLESIRGKTTPEDFDATTLFKDLRRLAA